MAATMSAQEFVNKWRGVTGRERATSQSHFIDVCALVGHPAPTEQDPQGRSFAFEAGVAKSGGGQGFADVWKRGFFAWEYKGPHGNLEKAHKKLDEAVLDAYGWPREASDEEVLARRLKLNGERAGKG